MTLWASSLCPSEQARVTSAKSCLAWRSLNVEVTFEVKSFHFRLYFWVAALPMVVAGLVLLLLLPAIRLLVGFLGWLG